MVIEGAKKDFRSFGQAVVEILEDLFVIQSIPMLDLVSFNKFHYSDQKGKDQQCLLDSITWMTVDVAECQKELNFEWRFSKYFIILKDAKNGTLTRRRRLLFTQEESTTMEVFEEEHSPLTSRTKRKRKPNPRKWSREQRHLSLKLQPIQELAGICKELSRHLIPEMVQIIKEYFYSADFVLNLLTCNW